MEDRFKDFYDTLLDNLDSYSGEYASFIDCGPNLFNKEYHLIIWNDIYIAPYYCYEIADIKDRSIFKNP